MEIKSVLEKLFGVDKENNKLTRGGIEYIKSFKQYNIKTTDDIFEYLSRLLIDELDDKIEINNELKAFLISWIIEQCCYSVFKLKKYGDKFDNSKIEQTDLENTIKSFKILADKNDLTEEKENEEFPNKKQILADVLNNMKLQLLCCCKSFEKIGFGYHSLQFYNNTYYKSLLDNKVKNININLFKTTSIINETKNYELYSLKKFKDSNPELKKFFEKNKEEFNLTLNNLLFLRKFPGKTQKVIVFIPSKKILQYNLYSERKSRTLPFHF